MNKIAKTLLTLLLLLGGTHLYAQGSKAQRTVVIVSDWDKAPYEYRNDQGQPAGFNVDVLTAILDEMGISYQYQMQEWSKAVEAFENKKADLIFDNARRYRGNEFFATQNIIGYYRISVATRGDSASIIPLKALERPEETAFYRGDYSSLFFREEMQDEQQLNYQSPKVALEGLVKGNYKYFVWGEEALKWKIKQLNLDDEITLHEVNIPLGEIHIIGRDRTLINEIDDHYSRLKQGGDIERIYDRWFHPERTHDDTSPIAIYIAIGVLLLAGIIYLSNRMAKSHIRNITRHSTDLNTMMYKALHMGNFHVMEYNIKSNRFTNRYGTLLAEEGMTLEDFTARIHPDEQAEFQQKMKQLLNGRERKFELEKRWNSGTNQEPKWLRFHGHAIVELDKEGHPEYVINVIHDITHNIEEEKVNQEILHRFDRLFNIHELAMSFYSNEGWLITLNERMKTLCGFENPDNERFWTTMNMYDIPLFRDAYPPERKNEDLQVCQIMEYPELGIKNYIEFHVMPVRNNQGEVTQFLDTTLDITDEHQIYTDIEEQSKLLNEVRHQIKLHEQRLHHLLTGSNIFIYDIDLATRTMTFSHSLSKVDYSITIDEYLDTVADDEREEAAKFFETYENQVFTYRHFKHTPESDAPQWLCYIGKKRYDEQGNHTGFGGIAVVVTDLIEAQKRLQETTLIANDSIRLKSVFLASMTHELRTPLNAIVGFTTILQMTNEPSERKELIDIVHNSCDMLERLINDILEASSITTDSPSTIKPEDVDFVKSFDNICLILQQRVTQANLEFQKDSPYENFYTTIDIARVQQIVTNFVTNAVKFTQQGHIKLGYRYERHGLYVYCEDTGTGIPKDKQEVIFDRFVKLDEFVQGTGMGLNICKGLTERMDGQIGVKSEGDGTGSTFWFWLPCERRLHKEKEEA